MPPQSSIWPPTDWTDVGHAAKSVGKDPDPLQQLILRYQVPLGIHLRARFPHLANQVEEVLLEFCEDKILKDGWLNRADREKGRFRAFLKASLDRFVIDRLRRDAKRPVSLEELEYDPPVDEEKDDHFNLAWAQAIVTETLRRMEADCKAPRKNQPNRPKIWEVFRLRVARPMLEDMEPMDYEELVVQCALSSPKEAQALLATGKRRFRRHVKAVVAEYEDRPDAINEEIEEIKRFLSRLAGGKTD